MSPSFTNSNRPEMETMGKIQVPVSIGTQVSRKHGFDGNMAVYGHGSPS